MFLLVSLTKTTIIYDCISQMTEQVVHLKVYLCIKSHSKELPVIVNIIHFDPFRDSPNSKAVNNKIEYFSTTLFKNNKLLFKIIVDDVARDLFQPVNAIIGASQAVPVGKNPPASAGDVRHGFSPWVRKIP